MLKSDITAITRTSAFTIAIFSVNVFERKYFFRSPWTFCSLNKFWFWIEWLTKTQKFEMYYPSGHSPLLTQIQQTTHIKQYTLYSIDRKHSIEVKNNKLELMLNTLLNVLGMTTGTFSLTACLPSSFSDVCSTSTKFPNIYQTFSEISGFGIHMYINSSAHQIVIKWTIHHLAVVALTVK